MKQNIYLNNELLIKGSSSLLIKFIAYSNWLVVEWGERKVSILTDKRARYTSFLADLSKWYFCCVAMEETSTQIQRHVSLPKKHVLCLSAMNELF